MRYGHDAIKVLSSQFLIQGCQIQELCWHICDGRSNGTIKENQVLEAEEAGSSGRASMLRVIRNTIMGAVLPIELEAAILRRGGK